jgi:transposase InsO family protein
VHVDVKKLGRFHRPGHRVRGRGPGRRNPGAGWEAVHVAVDDATRLAYVEVLPDERADTTVGFLERADTTVGFLERAVAWFADRGITIGQVMSDNGSAYVSRAWAAWMHAQGIDHIRTRPYRPRTHGKAERFIQTMLREWAYAASYPSSDHRRRALPAWIRYYNEQRPHGAFGHKTPAGRLHDD